MLPAILAGASLLGKLFGGGGKASADSRAQEAQLNQQRDNTAIARYNAEQDANTQNAQTDLNQRGFALQAPGERAGNSVRGDILAGTTKPKGGGRFDYTSMAPELSASTRGVGQSMARDALMGQLKGDTFAPIQKPTLPRATPIPQAGMMEKLGGLAGIFGGLAGGLQEAGLFGGKKPPFMGPQ
jgi:hypothetical protein